MWLPSQGQSKMKLLPATDKTALFSVRRDNRNHVVLSSHIMDEESETQVKILLQGYAAS